MVGTRWHDYPEPWRYAFIEAWHAYQEGGYPIGAVVATLSGEVRYRGHNRMVRRGIERGTRLDHAEYHALRQIPIERAQEARDYVLYSTLEPCPLCFGALVMSNVRHLAFAGVDPYAGSTALAHATAFIRERNLHIVGPSPELGPVQAVLLADYILRVFTVPLQRVEGIFAAYPGIRELVHTWSRSGRLARAAQDRLDFGPIADAIAEAIGPQRGPGEGS